MLCREIIDVIEKTYPKEYALEWDNVGLLAGRDDKEVNKIYVALDATDEVIAEAIATGSDLLITHHPMIFEALKQINNRDLIGKRILRLIQNDLSYYAMHTNYDVLGMSELSGGLLNFEDPEVLEVTAEGEQPQGIGRVAQFKEPLSLKACCQMVKEQFQLNSVKVFGDLDAVVTRAAISPGAGKSMVEPAIRRKADVLITGDIDHHTGIDALDRGLFIIDAGHYGIEHIFIKDMSEYLKQAFSGVEVIAAPVRHPFTIV